MKPHDLKILFSAGKFTAFYYDAGEEAYDKTNYFKGAHSRLCEGDMLVISYRTQRNLPATGLYTVLQSSPTLVKIGLVGREHTYKLLVEGPTTDEQTVSQEHQ